MRKILVAVTTAAISGISLSAAATTASAASVTVSQSWSGSVPANVQPGQSVTLSLKLTQTTDDATAQIAGIAFDVWAGSGGPDVTGHVQVQVLDPATGAWVTVKADPQSLTWTYWLDPNVTLRPHVSYSSGVRFTIDSHAPAGLWHVGYPSINGIASQADIPPGSASYTDAPERSFEFNAGQAPAATHSTAAASTRSTHAASANGANSSPSAKPTHSAAPSAAGAQAVSPAPSLSAAGASSAAPAASAVTTTFAVVSHGSKPDSTKTGIYTVGTAFLAAALAGATVFGFRRRRRRTDAD